MPLAGCDRSLLITQSVLNDEDCWEPLNEHLSRWSFKIATMETTQFQISLSKSRKHKCKGVFGFEFSQSQEFGVLISR